MSTMDPAKLKVVELRQELTTRGLDAKGNKPVLVKRLKEALEKELQQEIPDTSIVDTSTEDINTSQESITEDTQDNTTEETSKASVDVNEASDDIKDSNDDVKIDLSTANQDDSKTDEVETKILSDSNDKSEECSKTKSELDKMQCESVEESPSEEGDDSVKEVAEKPKKEETAEDVEMSSVVDNGDNKTNKVLEEKEISDSKPSDEPRGEKRRRSSPSPERAQRRRSKSPIKEDEPIIDNNKVQLSWYDSDLHLVVDKKSFLSAKPYHEGAFGYAWAGVRTTHGAKLGKVCYEVKITEELRWEDPVRQPDKRRDRYESSRRDRQSHSKGRNNDNVKADKHSKEKKTESENTESKNHIENVVVEETNKVENETPPEENTTTSDDKTEKTPDITVAIKEDNLEELTNDQMDKKNEESESMEVEDTPTEIKDKITEEMEVAEKSIESKDEKQEHTDVEKSIQPISKYVFRVGWSLMHTSLQLGETEYSYGYDSSGKFVTNKEFSDYGINFGVGDVVGAYINITEESVIMSFTVNGILQPEPVTIPRAELREDNVIFFPHILTRNCAFEVNLGARESPYFPHPSELNDYVFLECAEDKQVGPVRPELRSDCEVIMMCGLPAAGKTEWVRNMMKENPEKRFTVIGNSYLLEKMTVNGNPLKNSYKGKWTVVLDKLMKCSNILVEKAALRRRNYVIDQTNVFPSAQRRKMRLFEGFKRRAVVVVVGDEEQAKRRALQEAQGGKDVPDSAILEMKANMTLPRRGDWLEEVTFAELAEEEAKVLIQKYNQEGRDAGFGPICGRMGYHRENRNHPYRWDHSTSRRDYRTGYRDNRSYSNNRYDRPRQSGWQNRRPPPGSWNRNIRRDRGSSGSRDFRNNNRSGSGSGSGQERYGNRDARNRNQTISTYRNQRPQNSRNQPPSWQGSGSGGSWQGQDWTSNPSVWNQGNWSQTGWDGGSSQGQWKSYGQAGYNQGGGYDNYANWNYYDQYSQNWNSQGLPQTTTAGGNAITDNTRFNLQSVWTQNE